MSLINLSGRRLCQGAHLNNSTPGALPSCYRLARPLIPCYSLRPRLDLLHDDAARLVGDGGGSILLLLPESTAGFARGERECGARMAELGAV